MNRVDFRDNTEEFLREVAAETPDPQVIPVVMENVSPWAIYLHARRGFLVINVQVWAAKIDAAVRKVLESEAFSNRPLVERIKDAMERANVETVQAFQAETGTMRPPVTAGGPQRPAHAEGLNFADETATTASSYRTSVGRRPQVEHPYTTVPFAERGTPRRLRRTQDE